jgi:hypothetical protein
MTAPRARAVVTTGNRPGQIGEWGAWRELGIVPGRNIFVHSVIVDTRLTRTYLSYWNFSPAVTAAHSSSADLPTPGVPRMTNAAPPSAAPSSGVPMAVCSGARPTRKRRASTPTPAVRCDFGSLWH